MRLKQLLFYENSILIYNYVRFYFVCLLVNRDYSMIKSVSFLRGYYTVSSILFFCPYSVQRFRCNVTAIIYYVRGGGLPQIILFTSVYFMYHL